MNSSTDRSKITLPEGTVTFLFTDIEGSTALLTALGDRYAALLEEQRRIVRACAEQFGGQEVDTQGDSFFLSFPRATQAISAAIEIQKAIQEHAWPDGAEVRLRMGLHTGEPFTWAEGYVGIDVHRAARIAAVGHGGQVLLSETTTALIRDDLPEGVTLMDTGSHLLKDIPQPESLHQLIVPGLPDEFPALSSLETRPNNLPVQPTPFIGRVDELEALDQLITDPDNRLISIIGAGGMGKTRLAIAAAEQQLQLRKSSNGGEPSRFPDGVFFVALAPLESEEAIVPTIGQAIGFQFHQGVDPKKQLINYLQRKHILLVMDNFEHLKNGASVLTGIVEAAPGVKILVTSREKLNLRSEVPYPLVGMRYPEADIAGVVDPSFSAVVLFLRSTKRIYQDYSPDEGELLSIGRICRLVEGMPLAIELASSWMEMLTPAEITVEIQKSIDFLEAERPDAPERHQSVRAVFDYTWKLLSESERELLMRISVFRGGFSHEALSEVVEASNKQILGLLNKSLLQRVSANRFGIHELLRQYAAEALEKDQEKQAMVRDLHCAYFADYLHRNEGAIDGGDQDQALVEIDNIRTAWRWSVKGRKTPEIRKQSHSLYFLFLFQGWALEGEESFGLAVDRLRSDQPVGEVGIAYGKVLACKGSFLCQGGKLEEGLKIISESRHLLDRLDAQHELAFSNCEFARHDLTGGARHIDEARRHLLESLEYYKDQPDSRTKAFLLTTLGFNSINLGEHDEAENYFREGKQMGELLNNRRILGWATMGLGFIELARGNYPETKDCWEQSYAHYIACGYKTGVGFLLNALGDLLLRFSMITDAEERYGEALAIYEMIDRNDYMAWSLLGLGNVAFTKREYKIAGGYYEDALKKFKSLEYPDRGTGFVLCALGRLAFTVEDVPEARMKYRDALDFGIENKDEVVCMMTFVRVSALYLKNGEAERAVQLISLAANFPEPIPDTQFTNEDARAALRAIEDSLPPKDFESAVTRGKVMDVLSTAKQLRAELSER